MKVNGRGGSRRNQDDSDEERGSKPGQVQDQAMLTEDQKKELHKQKAFDAEVQ